MKSRRPIYRLNRRIATTGGAGGSAYSFATDPRVMARYRASDGLTDLSSAGILGPLVETSGAVAVGADSDGNAVWQLRTGSGGFLKTTANATLYYNPITLILIAKAGPSPTSAHCWATTITTSSSIFYSTVAAVKLTGSGSINIACTPANENVFMVYEHNNASQASVDGAAFGAFMAPGQNVGNINLNLTLGAIPAGTSRADVDIAEAILYEGPPTAQFLASLVPYLRSRYPSRGVAPTPPAPPSPFQTSRGPLPGGGFDFVLLGGQSNMDGLHSLSGVPTPAGAQAFVFASDNTIKAMPALYGDPTNRLDAIDLNALGAAVGGNGTALAAAYTVSTGRNLVVVPCAVGGTQLLLNWSPTLVRGNKQRNCLYGRMLDRARNMIAMGGTFRGLLWYQGETEAIVGGAPLASYQSDLNNFLNTFFADLGIPEKTIVQTLANTVAGASGPNLAAMQAAQAANAIPGQRLIGPASSGPYEADNLHLDITAQNTLGAAWAAQMVSAGW